ncbi:HU family DNA-binding protein [Xinfangfangia sp. CPCC 101601]|uniref:HU family DNA-binding protein n=1 Tax=Pseudogemmobacter lacusdianii TaxID=3069608 RepID=A0ABU0W0X9_9RHOB|nr:HU family DNA-binding protein [Xinfangfangia sp. CPCC 101601]MDQ2067641.1 HU family DNA-binding protein [Xinfangfangia sp. CPCC 101601]
MANSKPTADSTKAKRASTGKATAVKPMKAAAPAISVPPKMVPKPPATETNVVPRIKGPTLKIKDLVARVASTTGAKKKTVKEIVEATLTALGDGLTKGEDLNLPGIGRVRIARAAEKDGASMLTLKLRRGTHRKKDAKEPLAEEEDDG